MYRYPDQGKIITQVGSLPFTDVDAAIAYSLRHDIPFLPELTALGDGMLEYIKHPGQLSCLAAFKKQRFEIVKVQCIGPATLIQSQRRRCQIFAFGVSGYERQLIADESECLGEV